MISYKYASECYMFLEELFYSLSNEQKKELKKFLESWQEKEMTAWLNNNFEEIQIFAKATPHQRDLKKKWNSSKIHKGLLTYFSFRSIEDAFNFLNLLTSFKTNLGYREQAVEAANMVTRIKHHELIDFFASDLPNNIISELIL